MRRLPIFCAFLLPLCTFLLPLAAQDPAPPKSADLASYETLFELVLPYHSLRDNPSFVVNGELVTGKPAPKLQDVIGLTDAEVDILLSTARSCVIEVRAAMPQTQGMMLDMQSQNIGSGSAPEAEGRVVTEHTRIVTEHIQQLRSAYGEARFKVLDDYARSGKARKELTLTLVQPAGK